MRVAAVDVASAKVFPYGAAESIPDFPPPLFDDKAGPVVRSVYHLDNQARIYFSLTFYSPFSNR